MLMVGEISNGIGRWWKWSWVCPDLRGAILKLLFDETVFEEHENRPLGAAAVNVKVLAHADHGLGVHGLAGEELQVLESSQQLLHDLEGMEDKS